MPGSAARSTSTVPLPVNDDDVANKAYVDGGALGESNTISSVGGGTADLSAVPSKVVVDLRVKTLSVTAPITLSDAANLLTIGTTLGATLWEVLGDYEAASAEASHEFDITDVDFDDDSVIVVVIDGEATASLDLQMTVNQDVTSFFGDGSSIGGGTETLLDNNNLAFWELFTSIGANISFAGIVEICLTQGGQNFVKAFTRFAAASLQHLAQRHNTAETAITHVTVQTSTSTWKIGTRITVYKVSRA